MRSYISLKRQAFELYFLKILTVFKMLKSLIHYAS